MASPRLELGTSRMLEAQSLPLYYLTRHISLSHDYGIIRFFKVERLQFTRRGGAHSHYVELVYNVRFAAI